MEKQGNQLSRYGAIAAPFGPASPTGKVFFVADTSDSWFGDFQFEFPVDKDGVTRVHSTIDAAIGSCVADRGDRIYVAPNHAETVSAASGITLDVAGVEIVGLGKGENRPTITLDTAATADIAVSADDISVSNIRFNANIADLETVFEVGAAKNFTVDNCEFVEAGTDLNFVNVIRTNTTDNASDGLMVTSCTIIGSDTSNDEAVLLQGDTDRFVFSNNYVKLGVADNEAVIGCATGKDITNCQVLNNYVYRLNTAGDIFIENDTSNNSGIVAYNNIRHADTAGEVLVDADGVGVFENRGSAVDTAQGYLVPAIDS